MDHPDLTLLKYFGEVHLSEKVCFRISIWFQSENSNIQDDYEERLDELTFRYEERITELHSVIAELRKKIERHQINVIR